MSQEYDKVRLTVRLLSFKMFNELYCTIFKLVKRHSGEPCTCVPTELLHMFRKKIDYDAFLDSFADVHTPFSSEFGMSLVVDVR